MTGRFEREIEAWLAAELSGADEGADEALLRAFSALPRREPGPAFADRVMRSLSTIRPVALEWRSRWLRLAVAACLVATGLAVALVPQMMTLATLTHGTGAIVLAGWHLVSRSVAASFASWHVVEGVGFAVLAALANPVAVAVLLGNALVAAVSLLGLKRLLGVREETVPW